MTFGENNIVLVDPLSEVTRKERRMLLGLSMLGIFFVKAGALPSKINALGIEMDSLDQGVFLYLMSFCLLYFVIAFFIYAMSDFIVWRGAIVKAYMELYSNSVGEGEPYIHPDQVQIWKEEQRIHQKNKIWEILTKPMSISRAIFEFLLPLIVGIYSICIMILHASANM